MGERLGTLLAPLQAIIALGIGWLARRLRAGPAEIAGEVASLLLLTAGMTRAIAGWL
ncbi:MAG TPA: hypothetical protein VGS06_39380 [Streptosporangiaceae bacterium]|nr:hypothetical protein [Streptosporangiaceae bacterium]